MAQGAGHGELVEVTPSGGDEAPVGHVAQGRGHVASQAGRGHPRACREGLHRGQHQEEGGEQALGPAGVEGTEADPAVGCALAGEEASDEEAGQDEEEVDSQVAASGPGKAQVVGDHGRDGQGPQAV